MAPRTRASRLLDENQRLRVQLKSCDTKCQRVERQIAALQSRAQQAEAAAAQQLRLKEAEWMAEYDRSVQSLLKIIQHQEEEMQRLWTAALTAAVPTSITKMTRSTQTLRRNSVHFAKEVGEDDANSDNETLPSVNAKAQRSIARMQRLFEQLQVPRHQQKNTYVVQREATATAKAKVDADRTEDGKEHSSFKAVVLERLGESQTASSTTTRQRYPAATATEETRQQTTETQTDEDPAPKQSTSLQQNLEEHNRLLQERLASQQNVLDKLLHTKLTNEGVHAERRSRGRARSVPSIPSDLVSDCVAVIDRGESKSKDHLHHTPDPEGCLDQIGGTDTKSSDPIERPLSPAAA